MIQRSELFLVGVLLIVSLFAFSDLMVDASHGVSSWHLYAEAGIVLLSVISIGILARRFLNQRRELRAIRQDLEASKQHNVATDARIREARQQMGKLIQDQFTTWDLTVSEKEVALLLLKGLSFKEISAIRDTQEKTVRQQASSIYRKAAVSGRASFSAWFIEDIL